MEHRYGLYFRSITTSTGMEFRIAHNWTVAELAAHEADLAARKRAWDQAMSAYKAAYERHRYVSVHLPDQTLMYQQNAQSAYTHLEQCLAALDAACQGLVTKIVREIATRWDITGDLLHQST